MSTSPHILHLEDTDEDAELIADALHGHGINGVIERVHTSEEFIAALERGGIDVILSDFSLPTFDGLKALALVREKCPEVPFIFVSGTIGEETAIDALQCGAADYVFKHRLPRLGPAVTRAIAHAEKRRELIRAEEAMSQSEHKYRQLFECLGEAAMLADSRTGRIVDTNRQAEHLLGLSRAEILGTNVENLLSPTTLREYQQRLNTTGDSPERVVFEGQILPPRGTAIPVTISASPIVLYSRRLILGLYRDITGQKRAESEIRDLKDRLARVSDSTLNPTVP